MFKKFFKLIWKKKITILFIMIFSFTIGSFTSEIYNHFRAEYDIAFKSEKQLSNDNLTLETLEKVQATNEKFSAIKIEKMLNSNDIYLKFKNDEYHIETKSRYYADFFSSKSQKVKTRAEAFLQGLVLKLDENATFSYESIIIETNSIGLLPTSLISLGIGSLLYFIYLLINANRLYESIIENESQSTSIFSITYWKDSLNSFKTIKNISTIALLFALMIICKAFSIPTGFANLKISLVYLFFALISMIFGPAPGFIIGIISDVLGFFVFPPDGAFNFGYSLIAAFAGFTYGICFYKQKISFTNCFFSRLIVNIILNVIFGSILYGITFNYDVHTTIVYMVYYELPKNLIFLIPQSLLLYIFIKAISPILVRFRYLDKSQLINKNKTKMQ
ncbi:MAG: folate family ECF transporter S component [Erysipelotrichales bacterium]|nr:folate family ECF transporter S component [Erysipelotrichales bacterium]